jgi:peptide/nickel transport system substrate-binding protein
LEFVDNAAQITAQRLRQIGVNAQLATSDWGGVVTRRANKSAPDQGGWNIFITWAIAAPLSNPIDLAHAANGEKGWFGWPQDETHERLRGKWANAGSLEERKAIAREMQRNAWNFVPHVWLGQWVAPVAYRSNLRGILGIPIVIPFWNVEKLG